MVTIQDARTQLTQAKQSLQQQQQQIQDTRREVQQTALRALTRAELQRRGREDIIKRKLASRQLEGIKKEQLSKLDPLEIEIKQRGIEIDKFEQQVKSAETQQATVSKRQSDFKQAVKIFKSKQGDPFAPTSIKKFVRELEAGREIALTKSIREASAKIKELGLKPVPVIENGKLVAIKGEEIIKQIKQDIKKEDIKVGRLKQISLPEELPKLTLKERIKNIKVVRNIGVSTKRLVEEVTSLTDTTGLGKEKRVTSIELPSITKRTQITRPVDFSDINTGKLPPKQNMELAFNKVILDFNQGKISDKEGLEQLENIQKKFILDESKRTAGLRFVEGVGIGALIIIAPPIGFTIIGAELASAALKRKEIWEFSKTNPKAAIIQFGAGLLGGFIGAGGVKASKIKSAEIQTPTLELTGKARTKFEKQVIENLDEGIRQEFTPAIKNTAGRTFKIDIPSPKGKVELVIREFTKNNQKRFVGMEFINGKLKPNQIIVGKSITKGVDGRVDIITRSVKKNTKAGLSNIEFSEFLERAILKSQRKQGFRARTLTESEVKLSKQFRLRGLTPNQVREVLRRPLFGIKTAQRKANKPFTENEFKLAKELSKSQVLLSEEIVKIRGRTLVKQIAPLIAERNKWDIRVKETGIGISYVVKLPKAKVVVKKIKGVKVPVDVRDFTSIKITKLQDVKLKKKIPLERTFSGQSQIIQQVLKSKQTPKQKVQKLDTLQKKVSPTGAFKAIARKIQLERIKLAKKQALGESIVTASGVALKVRPKLAQKIKTLSKSKTKVSLVQVTPSLVAEAQKLALAGKVTQLQAQALRQRLAQKTGVPLKTTAPKLIIPTKPIIPIIPKAEKEFIDKNLISAIKKLKKEGVDVLVGLQLARRKTIAKNLPKWKALKIAQKFVDKNIEASYLLKKSGKIAKVKDIKPFNPSFKFRSSKTNPLFVVEKRKFRLDSPRELAQLKSFKGKFPSGFFPKRRRK